ncbi:glycosyltransferase family 2 protein [Bacteroides sp. GD17]|jgi:GT2 family glycosyltransferase|uniref:glycosyltransferase family 2 protein n=1 Tax=Bacteroides sp. GD17 TaxID=3139826 RepID=UPI0025E20176|nr:glycosyltransferase family 2 protein [uncultured Bacteroides sp.]
MVSIITINYNGWQDTCELIASLKLYETYPYEVIVVDNASVGEDVERIRTLHPDVKVVCAERNLGFAGGNNLGYDYAKGNFILFLNNDMVIKEPILHPLVESLTDSKIGGVSPCIFFYYHPEEIQYYGYTEMTPITLRHTKKPFNPSKMVEYMKSKETEVLHGGAMMLRRDVIERVGRMTEIYFLFYEEFDWSRRIRAAGYKLFYEPRSKVYHKESVSIPRKTPKREYYLNRSRVIYARRNCNGGRKLLACSYLLLVVLPKMAFIYLLKRRWDLFLAALRGTFAGLFKKL